MCVRTLSNTGLSFDHRFERGYSLDNKQRRHVTGHGHNTEQLNNVRMVEQCHKCRFPEQFGASSPIRHLEGFNRSSHRECALKACLEDLAKVALTLL
jgi:hypothetical protein